MPSGVFNSERFQENALESSTKLSMSSPLRTSRDTSSTSSSLYPATQPSLILPPALQHMSTLLHQQFMNPTQQLQNMMQQVCFCCCVYSKFAGNSSCFSRSFTKMLLYSFYVPCLRFSLSLFPRVLQFYK